MGGGYTSTSLTKAYFDSIALLKTYFDTTMDDIKNRSGSTGFLSDMDSLQVLGEEVHHISNIFPEGTDETLTFTAGGVPNVYSAWAEVIDSGANKISDKFTEQAMITAFLIEHCDARDKVYMFELAYGDSKTVLTRYRLIAGETVKLPAVQQLRIRGMHFPSDELIYYRMKSETAGAICELHIRYYLHRA